MHLLLSHQYISNSINQRRELKTTEYSVTEANVWKRVKNNENACDDSFYNQLKYKLFGTFANL